MPSFVRSLLRAGKPACLAALALAIAARCVSRGGRRPVGCRARGPGRHRRRRPGCRARPEGAVRVQVELGQHPHLRPRVQGRQSRQAPHRHRRRRHGVLGQRRRRQPELQDGDRSRTPPRSPASSSSATRASAASSAASRFYDIREPERRPGPHAALGRRPRTASAAAPSSATPSSGAASSSGRMPAEIRAGWQVINWGESTFIQGGINAINPIDVSVLRVPGAELRDALLPVGAVKFSIKPSANTSLEAFYQYAWEETKIDPVGSYFSTTDLAGGGRDEGHARLRLRARHDRRSATRRCRRQQPGGQRPCRSAATTSRPATTGSTAPRCGASSPALGGTEFGLYFLNYHSRLPLIMAQHRHGRRAAVAGNYAATANYFLDLPGGHQALRRQLQHPARPDRASRSRARSRTAWTCRCRSTTSSCSTRR